ncbi:MAG: YggS family pyridoxal phosphate-dependent enzyme [Wenzhouxiangella sp.]
MCAANQNPDTRYQALCDRIEAACRQFGRESGSVQLLAVSKKQPALAIRNLHRLGQRAFGENYVDEALGKMDELNGLDIEWHFIGPIQSNKTRAIAEHFDWVQSVDRAKIVRRLAAQRPEAAEPLNVLIQVNLDDEAQKAGCQPEELASLAAAIAAEPRLRLRGLMAIPAPREDHQAQQQVFERLAALLATLQARHPGVDCLSAGMSGDLEAAIAAGSSLVRVGTDLFGPRPSD